MSISTETNMYTDLGDLSRLRHQAKLSPQEAVKAVAKQYESLFIQMMLKSMRDASMGDPIFDSNQSEFYRDMLDNQLAMSMGQGKGIGLAEALERQFRQYTSQQTQPATAADQTAKEASVDLPVRGYASPQAALAPSAVPVIVTPGTTRTISSVPTVTKPAETKSLSESFSSPSEFVEQLWPLAEKAAEELGVHPAVLLAQSALETGWGRYVSRNGQGELSHNLFNIKADKRWDGDSVEVGTIEFMGGAPVKQVARFRAYDSYAQSFDDYVQFLKQNPRYENALQQTADANAFIRELHGAGFATDPDYANKVLRIMDREAPLFDRQAATENPGNSAG